MKCNFDGARPSVVVLVSESRGNCYVFGIIKGMHEERVKHVDLVGSLEIFILRPGIIIVKLLLVDVLISILGRSSVVDVIVFNETIQILQFWVLRGDEKERFKCFLEKKWREVMNIWYC